MALFDRESYALGESPYYDERFQRYSWVDILNGRVWTLADGNKKCISLGQPVGAAIPIRESQGLLLAAQDGLYVAEREETRLYYDLKKEYKSYIRSNDAKADPYGRIWFGSSVADDAHAPEGNLYCLAEGTLRILQAHTKISNGMAWSSDRNFFYFADSVEHAVFRYAYHPEQGSISGREVLFRTEDGVPDGMCIDAEDNLWVAIWGGSRVEKRCGKTGTLLAVIPVPAKQCTSCCFVGTENKLFITSAAVGQTGAYDGCLFTCTVDAEGVLPDTAVL